MSGTLLLCVCLAYFLAAYFVYGNFLKKLFNVDPNRPTPAHTQYDGVDFVPTPRIVLFGHHFASIAGPGPIVGPILAAYFGWLPALLWILIGCVFVGAFHDFASLAMSVRHRGHSISFIMERLMGYSGRQLFLIFCYACLLLVVGIFTLLIAGMFVHIPAVATASLLFICMAPIFGFCTLKMGISLKNASFVFVPLVFVAVWVGTVLPLDICALFGIDAQTATYIWMAVLAAYIFCASIIPVQWLLQPRDYLNSFLLYGMLILGVVSILAYNPDVKMAPFAGWQAMTADGNMTYLIPAIFIYIACGACSGFHALVASGTTSKQINSERDMLPIGYGSMLIEGVIGVITLVAVMNMDPATFRELGKNQPLCFATGIASFSEALGINATYAKIFISLAISAFMMTSLDTATRLGRFLWQEIFTPRAQRAAGTNVDADADETPAVQVKLPAWRKLITNTLVAAFIMVGMSMVMAMSGSAATIWPIFGASNQLMAGLTFLAITLYLLIKQSRWYLSFFSMILMMVMSMWGIVQIVQQQWGHSIVLVCSGLFLLAMAVLMIIIGGNIIIQQFKLHLRGVHAAQSEAAK